MKISILLLAMLLCAVQCQARRSKGSRRSLMNDDFTNTARGRQDSSNTISPAGDTANDGGKRRRGALYLPGAMNNPNPSRSINKYPSYGYGRQNPSNEVQITPNDHIKPETVCFTVASGWTRILLEMLKEFRVLAEYKMKP